MQAKNLGPTNSETDWIELTHQLGTAQVRGISDIPNTHRYKSATDEVKA